METYGIDLYYIIDKAKENGNQKLVDLIEKQIHNLQACYDVIAEKYTSCGPENVWNIDPEYLLEKLK